VLRDGRVWLVGLASQILIGLLGLLSLLLLRLRLLRCLTAAGLLALLYHLHGTDVGASDHGLVLRGEISPVVALPLGVAIVPAVRVLPPVVVLPRMSADEGVILQPVLVERVELFVVFALLLISLIRAFLTIWAVLALLTIWAVLALLTISTVVALLPIRAIVALLPIWTVVEVVLPVWAVAIAILVLVPPPTAPILIGVLALLILVAVWDSNLKSIVTEPDEELSVFEHPSAFFEELQDIGLEQAADVKSPSIALLAERDEVNAGVEFADVLFVRIVVQVPKDHLDDRVFALHPAQLHLHLLDCGSAS